MIDSIYEFGKQLIKTGEIDPIYIFLYEAKFDQQKLHKWLLAYWCFYHTGTASWISEGETNQEFWKRMNNAAATAEHPRGGHRRHYRGQAAIRSVAWLQSKGIEALFNEISVPCTLSQFMVKAQKWMGFGIWIAFKMADMMERLGLCQITIDDNPGRFLYKTPMKAAINLWKKENPTKERPTQDYEVGNWAIKRIEKELKKYTAPPRYERPINVFEAETILCEWNKYQKKPYTIGDDIKKQHAILMNAHTQTAKQLLLAGKKLWEKSI